MAKINFGGYVHMHQNTEVQTVVSSEKADWSAPTLTKINIKMTMASPGPVGDGTNGSN